MRDDSTATAACCAAPGAGLLDYPEALGAVLDAAAAPNIERLPVAAALGRVLAAPVTATESLPPFDNAAMDGYALRLAGRSVAAGSEFALSGAQFAGDAALTQPGEAIEITTGARVPEGFDSVVMVEQTRLLEDGRLRLEAEVRPGQHIRRCGEDIAAGDAVMAAGQRIDPAALGVLAALGVAEVELARRPRLGLIATGRELVDDPRQPLAPGQIRNSNLPTLCAQAGRAGAEVVHAETCGDEVPAFLAAVERCRAAGAEILVSTGAVSMGRFDFVPEALARLGAEVRFHKVRIRPGKPLLFARLPDGTCFFGLPGNPVSSLVGFRFFIEPLLRARLGLAAERPALLPLAAPLRLKPGLRFHLKARTRLQADGGLGVEVLSGQESFRLAPLLTANAWAVLDPEHADTPAGARIAVFSPCHLLPLGIVP
jgi:molybdopterin molybdotransferase